MANRVSKLLLNHSSMLRSLSSVESGRGSKTSWRRGAAVSSGEDLGIPVVPGDRRCLREAGMFALWEASVEGGL